VILLTTLTEAGFPMNSGKQRKSSRFENYSNSIDGGGGSGRECAMYKSIHVDKRFRDFSRECLRSSWNLRNLPSNLLHLVGIRNAAIYLWFTIMRD